MPVPSPAGAVRRLPSPNQLRQLPSPPELLRAVPVSLSGGASRLGRIAVGAIRGRRRHVWTGSGRAHVEASPADDTAARRLVDAVRELDGVEWAAWNPAMRRVIVSLERREGVLGDVVRLVDEAEDRTDAGHHLRPEHPADHEPAVHLLLEIGTDVVALSLTAWTALLRFAPVPVELASAITFVESQTRVRAGLSRRIGAPATDVTFAVASAIASGLAHGPLALLNDLFHRTNLLAEHLAHRDAWERAEARLAASPRRASAPAVDPGPRPVPMPVPTADAYSQRAGVVGLGAGLGLLGLGARGAAGAAFTAGISNAVTTSRAAYAAQLHRSLAARGVHALDRGALRQFEQVDAVVLGARLHETELGAHLDDRASGAGTWVEVAADDAFGVVRRLQADGRVVAAFGVDARALAAADVAVARYTDAPSCWHADLVADEEHFPLVLEGILGAAENARRSVALSAAGSIAAALLAVVSPRGGRGRAAADVVNVVGLSGLAVGTWDAQRAVGAAPRLGRRPDDVPWHAVATDEVMRALGTSTAGLSAAAVADAAPAVVPRGELGFVDSFVDQLANPLTPVLGAGAAASAVLGSTVDALLVGGTLLGNALLGTLQQLGTQRAVRALARASEAPVVVRRDGAEVPVPGAQVVRGDVVLLRVGDVVPADCRVIEARGLEVDESGLTGESLAVPKHAAPVEAGLPVADRSSMVYAGTTIAAGTATAVAVAVGDETEAARALALGDDAPPASGVEERLAAIARITVPVTLAAASVLSLNALLRGHPMRQTMTSAVGLVAAALPEGLPLVATTAQLGAARRLSERNAIVRAPRTIEALGRVDVLCFDKTGTLTEGEVHVRALLTAGEPQPVEQLDEDGRALLLAALHAAVVDDGDERHGANRRVHSADRALAAAADAHGIVTDWIVAADLPFEHERSFSATRAVTPDGWSVAVKGAPEVILERCTTRRVRGESIRLGTELRAAAAAEASDLAAAGYRVLAVAQRPASSRLELSEDDVSRLELLGFVALADRIRDTARDAVASLRRAGVDVVMITGDHPATARAVAADLGLVDGRRVLAGPDMDELDDSALDAVVEEVSVFARVTPVHKVRIVQSLRRRDRVVAMTGDGTNDAGAIRLAHVGVALGRRATPAARSAADLVVADDRLETIIDAIIEGRAMWGAVRDALSLLLGGNLGELGFAVLVGGVSGRPPLNARQTLLVNLLTDMLPAMAVASRPPRGVTPEGLLDAGPDTALGGALTRDVITRAVVTGSSATAAWIAARVTGRRAHADTVGLVTLVGTQLGQTLLASGGDPRVVAASIGSMAALGVAVQVPGVNRFFGCRALGPLGWSIACAATVAGTAAAAAAPAVARALPFGSGGGEARYDDAAEEPLDREERELRENQRQELLHDDLRRQGRDERESTTDPGVARGPLPNTG